MVWNFETFWKSQPRTWGQIFVNMLLPLIFGFRTFLQVLVQCVAGVSSSHNLIRNPFSRFMFFSLDRPVAKNQILNTKCCSNFFLSFLSRLSIFFFQMETTEKKFGRYLMYSFWFLVTGWSNEMNIWSSNFATWCTAARKMIYHRKK